MVEILDEGLLRSDFTFGFELEAFVKSGSDLLHEMDNSEDSNLYLKDFIDAAFSRNNMTSVKHSSYVHRDGSLSDPTGYPFEYSSNVYQVTPENIQGLIRALGELIREGIFTNDTCGFHHHLRFNGITERDAVWIYCNMAQDADWDEFKSLKTEDNGYISLFNDDYASYEEIDDLAAYIDQGDWKSVVRSLTTQKYRAFRIHPQGTIEWRGPRDFLDTGNFKDIKNFYITLLKLIDRIKSYMNSNKLLGTNITKNEFFDELTEAVKEMDEKPDLEFITSYDSNVNFKTRDTNRAFDSDVMEKLDTLFERKPLDFYKAVVENKKGIDRYLKWFDRYGINATLSNIVNKVFDLPNIDKNEFASKLFNYFLGDKNYRPQYILRILDGLNLIRYLPFELLLKVYNESYSSPEGIMDLTRLYINNGIKLKLSTVFNKLVNVSSGHIYSTVFIVLNFFKNFNLLTARQIYKLVVSLLMVNDKDPRDIVPGEIPQLLDYLFDYAADKKDEFNNFIVHKALNGEPKVLRLYVGPMPMRQLYNIMVNIPKEDREYLPSNIKEKIAQLQI